MAGNVFPKIDVPVLRVSVEGVVKKVRILFGSVYSEQSNLSFCHRIIHFRPESYFICPLYAINAIVYFLCIICATYCIKHDLERIVCKDYFFLWNYLKKPKE